MGEHDQHRQRIYNRFLREGLMGFEEHNAMEFLLFLAHARGDTNSLARRVIRTFGSLSAALDAPYEELVQVPGIGPSSAAVLKFIPQMCAYYLENKRDARCPLDSPVAAAEFLMPHFFAKTVEEFYIAALDDRRALLRFERLSYGTANTTSVSTAQVVEFAVRWRATGVILAHNHPRGVPLPSNSDLAVTKSLVQALSVVNIELVDHFIFCDADYLSFADSNYMDSVKGYKSAASHGTL